MNSTLQRRALDIFEASLGLVEGERAAFLAQAGASDPALAAELGRLEGVQDGAAVFLPTNPGLTAARETQAPPERIGVFRLGRLLGRGGMGTVYEAERGDGLFEQRVAIKMLASQRWSDELEHRFRAERRILARLEHRNIARLYDGGVTADGQSYIVMEFIDGLPITVHADRRALDLRSRIRLFGQLCGALQFAHQQLVVHADVKPSNVLVSQDGSVKLLDFGIAQWLDLTDATAPDRPSSGRSPLTTAYAPPERGAGEPATVAGDVFSLGVVLREMLRGPGVQGEVPADLSAIVETATAVEPAARYGSVAALWEDLVAWLNGLPVRVYPATLRYRAGRFVARNRFAVAISIVAALGLSLATVMSTRLYLQAERARVREIARFDDLRQVTSFLVNDLSARMGDRPGMVDANWLTLSSALAQLEELALARPDDAQLQIDLGRNIARIAEHVALGSRPANVDLSGVRTQIDAAARRLEALRESAGRLPGFWAARAEIARLMAGSALRLDGDVRAAERHAREAMKLADEALRRDPGAVDARAAALGAALVMANVQNGDARPREAIATIDRALHDIDLRAADGALSPRLLNASLEAAFLRCDVKRWSQADADALRTCEAVEGRLRAAVKLRGALATYESRLAYTLFLMASQMTATGDAPRALAMLDEARDIYGRILHFGDNDELSGYSLLVEAARAATLANLGRFEAARDSAAQLLRARRERWAADPGNHAKRREIATALRRVGEVELRAGDSAAACVSFVAAGEIWDDMERNGRLLAFDLMPLNGQVPWIRGQLQRCPSSPSGRGAAAL